METGALTKAYLHLCNYLSFIKEKKTLEAAFLFAF